MGKTALVRRFADGRRTVFHTGASRGQRTEFTVLARQVDGIGVSGVRDLVACGYTDWDDAPGGRVGAVTAAAIFS